ncbi:MAG: extracellular solute-binding protein [Anaerolineae bacterium]
MRQFNRRDFLRVTALTLGTGALASCAPQVVEKIVERTVEVEKVVEKEVEVEKIVEQTVVVEVGPQKVDLGGKQGVLWGLQYDPHVAAYQRLARLFSDQTGATLAVEPQAWPLETKLIAALAAGTQPDVCCIMGKMCVPLYVQGALLPLKELVFDHNGIDPQNDFIGDGIGAYTWEGEIYGVPTESNGVGSMVNVPIDDVEAAGLTDQYPPTNGEPWFESYESMWELAKALQVEEDGRVVRWGLSSKGWDNQSYLGILRSLLAPKGTDWWDSAAQKFNIDSEEGIEAMRLFAETPVKMGIETELDKSQIDAAMAGQVAIARGNGTPSTKEGYALGYNFRLCGAPPAVAGTEPMYVGEAGWGFVALKATKNPDISAEFLRMMCTTDGQREYDRIYGGWMTPPWKGLVGQFDHFEDPNPESPGVMSAKIMQDAIAPRTTYYGEGYGYPGEVDGIGGTICSEVRMGNMTAEEGVKEYQLRCEAQYNQYLEDIKA